MDDSNSRRIVVLGKTGTGKSSACNTIFGGEAVFRTNHTANPGTSKCEAKTRPVNGRSITLIDTPGFFDPNKSEEEQRDEIATCITQCAPGPHAFIIFLKVEKYTEHENQVIDKIQNIFSEEAFKYAVVVFTHGDQLPEGEKIEEFVRQNKGLSDLVKQCGGRCHVIDNKYWKNNQQDEYRSNQVQVAEILNTIDKMVEENRGGCYTNEMLQIVDIIITNQGKIKVHNSLKESAGITAQVLFGALLGWPAMIKSVVAVLKEMLPLIEVGKSVAGALGGAAGIGVPTTGLCVAAVSAVAAVEAGVGTEAIENIADAVRGQNSANI